MLPKVTIGFLINRSEAPTSCFNFSFIRGLSLPFTTVGLSKNFFKKNVRFYGRSLRLKFRPNLNFEKNQFTTIRTLLNNFSQISAIFSKAASIMFLKFVNVKIIIILRFANVNRNQIRWCHFCSEHQSVPHLDFQGSLSNLPRTSLW